MNSEFNIEALAGWTREKSGCNSNPGCWADGNGGHNFRFVNRDFPGVTGRTNIRAGCYGGSKTDWFEVDRLRTDRDLSEKLISNLEKKSLRSLLKDGYVSIEDIRDNRFSSPNDAKKVIILFGHL